MENLNMIGIFCRALFVFNPTCVGKADGFNRICIFRCFEPALTNTLPFGSVVFRFFRIFGSGIEFYPDCL